MHIEIEEKKPQKLNQLNIASMKRTFTVITTKSKVTKVNGKRVMMEEPMTLQVQINVESAMIDLKYGYKCWRTEAKEGWDSVLPGQKYQIHHSIWPKEGDTWIYGKRKFVVGRVEGFVVYHAPLLENGKEVAQIRFEDYYKD